jgi:hypothetical protein
MEWLLKWLCSWAKVIDGVVGILTLGFIMPHLTLEVAKQLAKLRMRKRLDK